MKKVLNLIINGLPSILKRLNFSQNKVVVLNLIINGLPSICDQIIRDMERMTQF